jgi:hypothetical protein
MRHAALRLALPLLAAAVLAPSADAQIPSVPRRVRETAARAAGTDSQTVRCDSVLFDSTKVELHAAQLDRMIKGMRASRDVLEGRRGNVPSWTAMASQRDAAANALATLLERKGSEMDAYRENHGRVDQCRGDAFHEKREARRNDNMQRVMSDPDFMQRLSELSLRMSEAQQRGDTAAANRLAKDLDNLTSGLTREDTVAVDRQCGRLPAPPASVVQRDSLQALQDTLWARMRRREAQADSAAIAASGMTTMQMFGARERLELFLAKSSAESARICGYSEREQTAIRARRADLDELL